MKRNVQIYDKDQLRTIMNGHGIKPILCPTITKDGDYIDTGYMMDSPDGGDDKRKFADCMMSPNDIAHSINMPLWEVIMVDNGGHDEYALLFYEEG